MDISATLEQYRGLVREYLDLHQYGTAQFWADKAQILSDHEPQDCYRLARCLYLQKQYHRAAILLQNQKLDKSYLMCTYLTAKCYAEALDYAEALKCVQQAEAGLDQQLTGDGILLFESIPKNRAISAFVLLKGEILEAMDNRLLAAECYKKALKIDEHCFEAFNHLVKYQMLTAREENETIETLPAESDVVRHLYGLRLKKYHTPQQQLSIKGHHTNNEVILKLNDSLEVMVADSEVMYYNCAYDQCLRLTERVLSCDPYHDGVLPIHISCLVELKLTSKLFSLAHNLVNLYPTSPLSWFAVGCYYYVIGKSDSARRFLAKCTSLDKLFGPAWLAYGHSFADEKEHDQAMAAYFKAFQFMKGCHLPHLYIGIQCGLTNNQWLAEKFFEQAQTVAPDDPFILHERGHVCFQNHQYDKALQYFKDAEAKAGVQRQGGGELMPIWAPLLDNLGHTCRKMGRFATALIYHQRALVLHPQNAATVAAMAYVYLLMQRYEEAIDWFHKALALKRDDIFSTTMLSYAIEMWADTSVPFVDCPEGIPKFVAAPSTGHVSDEDVTAPSIDGSTRHDTVDMSLE